MRSQSGATIGGTHVGQSTRPHGDTGGKEACARRRARARAPRSSPRRYPGRGGDPASAQEVGPVGTAESSGLGLGPQHCMRDPPRARGGRGVGPPLGVLAGSPPRPAIPEWPHWRLGPLPGGGGGRRGRRGRTWSSGGAGPEPWSRRLRAPSPGGPAPPGGAGSSPPPPIPSQPERERERAWRSAAVCRGTSEETLLRLPAGIADRRRSSLRGGGGLGAWGWGGTRAGARGARGTREPVSRRGRPETPPVEGVSARKLVVEDTASWSEAQPEQSWPKLLAQEFTRSL